ncbi:hypothetical protein ANCDUO_08015 [Ancylostoma duodenale]|uniref:Uncharacterized protein n=1 Tax=Ancylostoma duodenale TaxID=51022 RepID=A0A0C2DGY0_9BILA|nr:hypothetical protein ANCDUO_08015 [Ancylostoma duodenale]
MIAQNIRQGEEQVKERLEEKQLTKWSGNQSPDLNIIEHVWRKLDRGQAMPKIQIKNLSNRKKLGEKLTNPLSATSWTRCQEDAID